MTYTQHGVTSLGSAVVLANGAVHQGRVVYDPAGILSVFVDDMTTPKLTVSVDIDSLLDLQGGNAWVGFTSGTGSGYENHDLLTWQMCPAAANRDLSISTTAAPDPVPAGDPLTLTTTVRLTGNAVAPAVVLTDVLPAGVTFREPRRRVASMHPASSPVRLATSHPTQRSAERSS